MKENDFRTLNICNFRNLGAYHTKEKDGRAFLKINRSLERDKLGGLVLVIGANNSGKSNVLEALDRANTQKYTNDDYTDFTYSRVNPHVSINVANGKYVIEEGMTLTSLGDVRNYSGNMVSVFEKIALEYQSYLIYCSKYGKVDYGVYRSKIQNEIYNLGECLGIQSKELVTAIISDRTDVTGWNVEKILQNINDRNEIGWDHVRITSRGISYSPELDVEGDLGKLNKSPFSDDYGYHLSNKVIKYSRKELKQNDLSCKPGAISPFFKRLLEIMEIDPSAITNAYSEYGGLRTRLEDDMNRKLEEISDDFNNLFNFSDKKYSMAVRLEKENIDFFINYGNKIPRNLNRQSEGFRWLFDFYFGLIKSNSFQPGSIILIDEFGNSLNFNTVRELAEILRNYAKESGVTFVMATQNPMAIDIRHLDEIRIVTPQDDGSAVIMNNFDEFGENNHDVLEPVINGLTVSRNYLRTENRTTVFVEGSTDYFYLNAMAEMRRTNGADCDLDFIPINGIGSRKSDLNETLKTIKPIERNPLILVDGDAAGEDFSKKAEKMNVKAITLSEIFDGQKKEIEDLFSEKDAERLSVHRKSFDAAACFSQDIAKEYASLDEETKSNFEKVLEYLLLA